MRDNDVQLFDLWSDPLETHNLALDPEKNKDLILRMNALLNELMPMKRPSEVCLLQN
jgi:arylsulfatase